MTDEEVASDLAMNIAGGLNTIRAAVALFGKRGGTILVTGGSALRRTRAMPASALARPHCAISSRG
jgi:hypothetical protein